MQTSSHENNRLNEFQYSPFSPFRTYLASLALGVGSLFIPSSIGSRFMIIWNSLDDHSSLFSLHNNHIIPFFLRCIVGPSFLLSGLWMNMNAKHEFTKKNTPTNPLGKGKVSALVTSGIYSYCRNPIYMAGVLIQLGISCSGNSWLPLLCLVPWFLALNLFTIPGEEKGLEKLFGNEYLEYKKRTKRWILF
ncbi:hypothetical protein C9374_014000 [Naegleria lovaniensis]|uniref:Protein-S-isoprenylcysteine O-methyltransferase n=1 Tax=Naegleria lovaniensis TaxID=51637 RepID=A0AA88KMY2_NAELO|nr:uncharacterized protein C9374_014000 [Naegleria lovaniensis]KAG2389440.1 hypothetical protein C9374_014000 [Naegleria lovaniensis]